MRVPLVRASSRGTIGIMSEPGGGARTVAWGTAESKPAWLRRTEGESRWWVGAGLLAAIGVQFAVPSRFVLHPAYVAPTIELVLLLILAFSTSSRIGHRSPRLRFATQVVLGLIAITNTSSLVLLTKEVTTGGHINAVSLLAGGAEIWLTNTIIFAIWYWEYDRGGPGARAEGLMQQPDLLFPQMTDERLARDWEPNFLDYLYVSFTNSTAFSPTDTMPLSRWIKMLFTLQAAVSFITVALVAARAVNILPGT
jgi:uncharacterized membrane protein